MTLVSINEKLFRGEIDEPRIFPHLFRLKDTPFQFHIDFGLDQLPKEPGILLIRGARQYGKSTWLEQQIRKTIEEFGAGSAYYLNGDNIADSKDLERSIEELTHSYPKDTAVKRLFIDEITAIPDWEFSLKRLADQGKLSNILVVTTGSKATDIRRGAERLPGRKGKLKRTTYLFTPISYSEFKSKCGEVLGKNTLIAYLLSGGSPIACAELATSGVIPEYVIELVRDWIDGEITATGRSRSALLNVMNVLYRFGGAPVGQAKLAREAGLANNTVAANYIEILHDLACVTPAYPWDKDRNILIFRKECKYHFTNTLVATSFHSKNIRSPQDFLALSNHEQGIWYEWLVAQELLRRNAIQGNKILEPLGFWQNKNHEIDFVLSKEHFLEVKRGRSSPLEFAWFQKQFPYKNMTVINTDTFMSNGIRGVNLEQFLLNQ